MLSVEFYVPLAVICFSCDVIIKVAAAHEPHRAQKTYYTTVRDVSYWILHFYDHLKISELASRHLYRLWNRHWYQHCKNVLPWEILKNRIFMLYIVCSYGISTTLPKVVISLRFRIHPSKGVHWCFRKRLFELLEGLFWKITVSKISAYFPEKRSQSPF